jgi:hypothetical protein
MNDVELHLPDITNTAAEFLIEDTETGFKVTSPGVTLSPAAALSLILYIQDRLALNVGAERLIGPYEKCPNCLLWIHKNSPVKHTCKK